MKMHMKLYVYDHCPFCVRARMPLGLKGIEAETVFVPNHDEATPISMIGAKMLPILEDADGYMGESLDIVHKLDGMTGARVFGGEPSQAITGWLSAHDATINTLVIPRAPDPVYPEFRDPEAVAYFTGKKEARRRGTSFSCDPIRPSVAAAMTANVALRRITKL